jgi:serine/threonine protein kinase
MAETPRSGTKVGTTDWFQMTKSGPETPAPTKEVDVTSLFGPPQAPGEIGRLAHYRILKPLGAGGMGMVFLAEDVQLKRQVAIKIVHPDANNQEAKQRIVEEARALAAIRDERVVTIHQVGEERDLIYLAMEYLPGEALDSWLERNPKPTLAQILYIGKEAALGLEAAHTHHLIHRDVKPANIWLEPRPQSSRSSSSGHILPHPGFRIKLLDFGLARKAKESFRLTKPGSVMGTPHYIAPEQAQGAKPDVPSDLYSLGVVLYRLCTGRLPFPQDDLFALMTALATQHPPHVQELAPDLPPALAELVMRLLAKNPAERLPSALAVAEALEALERGENPVLPKRPAPPPPRRWPLRSLLLVAGILLCTGIIWLVVYFVGEMYTQHQTIKEESAPKQQLPLTYATPPAEVLKAPPIKVAGMLVVGRKQYPRLLAETSALVKSTKHPDIYWTLNDHLNAPHLYAIEASGKLRAVVNIQGAENDDWESLTSDGAGNLYIGDTGNNDLKRSQGCIYRIREPDLPATPPQPGTISNQVPVEATFHYSFPGRSFDCEAIFFRQGEVYLLNLNRDRARFKEPQVLYRLPLTKPGVAVPLEPICRLPDYLGEVRDASLSPDGRRLAFCNSRQVTVYDVKPDAPLASLATQVPRLFRYPNAISRRFEGCAWDGDGLLLIAEGTTEIFRVTFSPP